MKSSETSGNESLREDIERILISRDRIALRVDELAREIAEQYRGEELTLLAVLRGSLIFTADLIRRLPLKVRVEMLSARSYPGTATQAQELKLEMLPRANLHGRAVLVVDDILDSGQTLRGIIRWVESFRPASIKSCVLLSKVTDEPDERAQPDFVGFSVEPSFVVGYGLDYDDLYRNLPDICVLKSHVMSLACHGRRENGGLGK